MSDKPKPTETTNPRAESELSAAGCSDDGVFYVVMIAQKFENHLEAFGGAIPVQIGKGCPKRFLAVFDDKQEATEWAGDPAKVRMACSL